MPDWMDELAAQAKTAIAAAEAADRANAAEADVFRREVDGTWDCLKLAIKAAVDDFNIKSGAVAYAIQFNASNPDLVSLKVGKEHAFLRLERKERVIWGGRRPNIETFRFPLEVSGNQLAFGDGWDQERLLRALFQQVIQLIPKP